MKIKKKSPAGRKPVEDKKVVVNLFIRQSELDKRGGKEEVQKQCYEFLGVPLKQRTTDQGLPMLGALKYKCLNIVQMSNRITKAELLTSAPILAKPCWWQLFLNDLQLCQ